ncbi:MAG TPA: flagellar export chaperone FliS [Phycisphaerae bacterium]|nr:flagellar export chaperone FliS [Phycisphaerae bacterium]
MATTAPNSYLRDAVMTATPEQLQLMLYDGAIRFASQARDAIVAGDYETSYEKLSRAQAIMIEMESGLRRDVNADLCERMAAIYGFLYRKLVEASVNKDTAAIDDALKVLRMERETWVLLLDKINTARAQAGTADPQQTSEHCSLCVEG